MQEQLKVAIESWQKADREARENTKLLLHGGADGERIAGERMGVLFLAESTLVEAISVTDPAELPRSLVVWLATSIRHGGDSGCSECWLSSAGGEHPECVEKIKQYFKAVRAMRAL